MKSFSLKQECIPVGCVPSAAVAVSAPGVGGVCLLRGGLVRGGVPVPGGCACSREGVVSPPVNRMTDRCKNITFATSLRTVIKDLSQAICYFLKVETTLRRAMQPNVNDVGLKWGSDIKAIHIPSELPPIFMGERMITYAVIKTDKKVQ